jgi:hypothetical protein
MLWLMQLRVALLSMALAGGGGGFRGAPRGPLAIPKLVTAEYTVEGRVRGAPIPDHVVTLEVQVDAGEDRWLQTGFKHAFDVSGGCCFETLHFDAPKLTACVGDESHWCRATFAVPFRVGSHGIGAGQVTFSLCSPKGCSEQKVGVAVPLD